MLFIKGVEITFLDFTVLIDVGNGWETAFSIIDAIIILLITGSLPIFFDI
ncbi:MULTISPECIES: hypothetical protein [Bacillus]|nr:MULTISPECIES: hypothetical protein [Bacillus]MCW1836266.1 hypothetical protein [Bacillus xiamenensis]QGX66426.1 hypothetical protein GPA07_13540 [Bacillus sp. ms-22]